MSIALRPANTEGRLTAMRALGRLHREAPRAVGAAAGAVLLIAAGLTVAFSGGTALEPGDLIALTGLGLGAATCAALGAIVVAGRPVQRFGLALLVGGTGVALWLFATAWASVPPSSSRPLVAWSAWLENWIFVGVIVLVTWPLLLFPDGSLPSRRWRPLAALVLVATAGVAVAGILDPGTLDAVGGDVPNPLGVPASWTWVDALGVLGFAIPISVVIGAAAVHRRAREQPGAGMRPAVWAARGLALNFVLVMVLPAGPVYAATLTASVAAFACAATVAVLRHRVVEVDVLLRRAFVVTGTAAASFLVFVVVFAVATTLSSSSAGALGGAVAVVIVAASLRQAVRDRVDRALYGHRDPSAAVARVNEQLDLADELPEALPGVALTLRDTLGASGVLIVPESPRLAEARVGGEPHEPAIERRLTLRGRALGRLVVGARTPGEAYGPGDIALADLLVRHVALALEALTTAAELQQSREEILSAREEERRRLRRELHDGLGSALAGIALTLQAAGNTGGLRAEELVDGAREQAEAAVADVRRMVRGLRPPILEDLGLVAAVRAHADRLAPLDVALDVPDDLAALPAAHELALYRIATEALTNVARHAGARHCRVRLREGPGEIVLQVVDDGGGPATGAVPGVGLGSMRDRATELGGRVELSPGPSGGLAVDVRLPLPAGGSAP